MWKTQARCSLLQQREKRRRGGILSSIPPLCQAWEGVSPSSSPLPWLPQSQHWLRVQVSHKPSGIESRIGVASVSEQPPGPPCLGSLLLPGIVPPTTAPTSPPQCPCLLLFPPTQLRGPHLQSWLGAAANRGGLAVQRPTRVRHVSWMASGGSLCLGFLICNIPAQCLGLGGSLVPLVLPALRPPLGFQRNRGHRMVVPLASEAVRQQGLCPESLQPQGLSCAITAMVPELFMRKSEARSCLSPRTHQRLCTSLLNVRQCL